MTKEELKASWNEMKGTLKQKYAKLTDQDLTWAEGKEDDLYLKLQQKMGKTRADVDHELQSIFTNLKKKEDRMKVKH
jgi:uncharacterized protein YjbJ (UPF0337 family)